VRELTKYLICAGCGKQLSGVKFTEINGQPFCATCEPVPAFMSEPVPAFIPQKYPWEGTN